MHDRLKRASRPARLSAAALAIAAVLGTGCATTSTPDPTRDTKRALARYDLGVHSLSQGRVALAIRELRAARDLSPGDPWIRAALAEAYRRRGKIDEAEAELAQALLLDPGYHEARLNLSALHLQVGRHADAVPHLKQLADDATFRAPWRALSNLGWAQLRLGRVDEARRSLGLAIDYRDDYWPALLNLGILEQEQGQALDALRMFRRVLETGSSPGAIAEANYRIAEIHVSLGQRERAVTHLSAAVAAGPPGGVWSRRSEEYLDLLQ